MNIRYNNKIAKVIKEEDDFIILEIKEKGYSCFQGRKVESDFVKYIKVKKRNFYDK